MGVGIEFSWPAEIEDSLWSPEKPDLSDPQGAERRNGFVAGDCSASFGSMSELTGQQPGNHLSRTARNRFSGEACSPRALRHEGFKCPATAVCFVPGRGAANGERRLALLVTRSGRFASAAFPLAGFRRPPRQSRHGLPVRHRKRCLESLVSGRFAAPRFPSAGVLGRAAPGKGPARALQVGNRKRCLESLVSRDVRGTCR